MTCFPTRRLVAVALVCALPLFAASAQERMIVVASTTSTQDSGLFDHLLPLFTAKTGIKVRVVAQGTGKALDTARKGDADVVLVHARPLEEKFVAEGFGVKRFDVMFNDFLVVGPKSDPAGIKGVQDVVAAFRKIAEKGAPFVSRGDKSGTHEAELSIWKAVNPAGPPKAPWYREIGQGMGAALNIAAEMDGYVLADRGTWLSFKNRRNLVAISEGDQRLANPYGVILVNPAKHPHVKAADGQAFIDWLVSPEGQAAIRAFRIDGEPLFFPNAKSGA